MLQVVPWDDDDLEEDETVIAHLSHGKFEGASAYQIVPTASQATVTIHDTDNQIYSSPPIEITVDGDDPIPGVLRIEASQPIAEETSAPLRRIKFVGEFTITRTGSTELAQLVWVHYTGSAIAGEDYEAGPLLVSIPEGESSVAIPIEAFYDELPEGIETVVATLDNCPPPPMRAPCYFSTIDPAHSQATVWIREDGLTTATVHITEPEPGDHFALGEPIQIQAVAIDLEGYIHRVEFWDGQERIGVSELYFFRAPDPGTPIHHSFEWTDASAGEHALTARAGIVGSEQIGVSEPVEIRVVMEPPAAAFVSVRTHDAFAVEPGHDRPVNTASFLIRRHGTSEESLTVRYSMRGRATNGEDYAMLSGITVIPAGHVSELIQITPLPDELLEGLEGVVLQLEESPDYRLGLPRRAAAVIADQPRSHETDRVVCNVIDGPLVHICFPAEGGKPQRLEVSGNLRDWITLLDCEAIDGEVHYVDDETPEHQNRFFRLVPADGIE